MQIFSQNDEQTHFMHALSHRASGTLLDVGAWSGKSLSNSYALIQAGWSAVLLEPSPRPFADCTELHASNPRVHCINAALTDSLFNELKEFQFTDDAVSTDNAGFHELWKTTVPYRRGIVQTLTVSMLVDWLPFSPNFLTIDTEGSTLQLTKALLAFQKITQDLDCICVEHIELGTNHHAEFDAIIAPLGFKVVYESGENLVYAKA